MKQKIQSSVDLVPCQGDFMDAVTANHPSILGCGDDPGGSDPSDGALKTRASLPAGGRRVLEKSEGEDHLTERCWL